MSATNRPDLAYRYVLALTGALFPSYLAVAMWLSAVPIYVVNGFHLSNAYAGLVVRIAERLHRLATARVGLWIASHANRLNGKVSTKAMPRKAVT